MEQVWQITILQICKIAFFRWLIPVNTNTDRFVWVVLVIRHMQMSRDVNVSWCPNIGSCQHDSCRCTDVGCGLHIICVAHIDMWSLFKHIKLRHYSDVIMSTIASQITSVSVVCLAVCSGADQRKHQSFALLAFVKGIHRSPVKSPHKGPVTRKMFPFDDVIMRLV